MYQTAKKLSLREIAKKAIPCASINDLIEYHKKTDLPLPYKKVAGETVLNSDAIEGNLIISMAARYARARNIDSIRVVHPRFSKSSSYGYCPTIVLLNTNMYDIPNEKIIVTKSSISPDNNYCVISWNLLAVA